jgi:hypothetical protein
VQVAPGASATATVTVRRDGVDTAVASFGQYAAGDVLRLVFTGTDYSMYCNGRFRGTWVDRTSMVVTGEDHRSLGIRVHGAQEQSGSGPRRFSPALDYVEYG